MITVNRPALLNIYLTSLVFVFLSLVSLMAGAQCVTADLNISTGYNQATGTTVTPSNTTIEPAWTSRVSSAAATSILAMPDIIGCYDAVPCPSWPAPITGTTWAMGQNDWGYMTTGTSGLGFTDTFSRPFMVCGTDSINLVINNLITDDGITEITFDGTVLVAYPSPSSGISYYGGATYHLGMLSGNHSIGIVVYNLNNGVYKNAIGLDASAHLLSASGTASLSTTGYCPVYTTSAKDTAVCSGASVTLYADTAGSYQWSTGAADTLSSITVTSSGTYWVLISKGDCRYEIDTTHLSYGAVLAVNLGNDTAICAGASITLAPTVPPGSTFNWSTGATTPSITVSSAGTYWVEVNSGSCSGSDTIHVSVNPVPTVSIVQDTFSNCFAIPVTLQAVDSYATSTYLWNTGGTTSAITVTSAGTYWVAITVNGCTGFDTINVTMAVDTFHLFNGDTAICRGKSVPVFLNINPLATVQWLPTAGIPNYTLPQPVITPDTSAMYRVTVSLPGCPDVTDSFYIDVQPNPVLYAGGNRSVCQFDTLHLHASVTPNWYTHYTYSWSPATSLDDPTQPTVIFTPGADTKYYVTVTTPHGCSSIDSASITVYPNNFAKLDTSYTLCPHDSVQLQPSGGVSYIWHPGMYLSDSTSSSPWVYAITSISYTAVAISQYGCLDTVTTHVTIQPQAHIYLPDSIELYSGQTYQLDPQTNCTYFTWFPQAGLDNAYISNPVASPLVSTKYIVHGRTEWGCEAVDSISFYLKETVFGVPNAFTPGQEVNGKLLLMKLGNGTLNYFRIYNRWGNKVFETSNINEGWDGSYKGVPQPFDVYVYVIEATTDEGKIFKKQGNITLIR